MALMAGSKRLLFGGVSLGVLLLAGLLWWATSLAGGDENGADSDKTQAKVESSEAAPAAPDRLVIPKLDVDAEVVSIKSSGGVLLPPQKPKLVGWWSGGAKPGEKQGSVVVAGHTVHTGGGALDPLADARPGVEIDLYSKGVKRSYTVDAVVEYEKGELADQAAQIFDQEVESRLVVVTCDDWNGSEYLSNVVVYASPKQAA